MSATQYLRDIEHKLDRLINLKTPKIQADADPAMPDLIFGKSCQCSKTWHRGPMIERDGGTRFGGRAVLFSCEACGLTIMTTVYSTPAVKKHSWWRRWAGVITQLWHYGG